MAGRVTKEFLAWLKSEMESRDWGISYTAQKAGVSHPVISDIINLEKQPTFETCVALARAFDKRPEEVIYKAGLLPVPLDWNPDVDELHFLFDRMTGEQKEVFMELARALVKREGAKREREKAK